MNSHSESIAHALSQGPLSSRALQVRLSLSQATVSRVIASMGPALVRIGAGRSVSYALRDGSWPDPVPVYRVEPDGRLLDLGTLFAVRPEGFVMREHDGTTLHSDGLPWWLVDMRPQGFLGRAFAQRHAKSLALPGSISDWNDQHFLKALVGHGHDSVGNLLLGDLARQGFLGMEPPSPVSLAERPEAYARLAVQAAEGELPTSSAGGEQPKFTTYAETDLGPRHVIVKFSQPVLNAVSERWRDLLLTEHLALQALRQSGALAAATEVVDHGDQRFLQVERFDRVGAMGRRALHSLGSLDDEFVGDREAPWPIAVGRLIRAKVVAAEAEAGTHLLYAYGLLIGNTDMHMGNLSFMSDSGRPYQLAPAYDMLPMGFAPTPSGALRNELKELVLPAFVPPAAWLQALQAAQVFLESVQDAVRAGSISADFGPCLDALAKRQGAAQRQISRLVV